MDAATLRLILVVIGAVFLIGLYLWEKQRAEGTDDESRRERPAPSRGRHEPNLGRFRDDDAFGGEDEAEDVGSDDAQAGLGRRGADADEAQEPASPKAEAQDTSAAGEQLLIQLYITSSGSAFSGEDILAAAERCKVRPGDMDIFHRTRGDVPGGEPLFSMANLVKPGVFPFDDMTEFASPGLAVFGQFQGEPSDLMVFDEMLDAARIMAELLGGDIRGPGREPLRDADAKVLRGRVSALLQGGTEDSDAQ